MHGEIRRKKRSGIGWQTRSRELWWTRARIAARSKPALRPEAGHGEIAPYWKLSLSGLTLPPRRFGLRSGLRLT